MFISHLRRFLNSYDNAKRTKMSNLENNWFINSNGESLKLYASKLRSQYFKHHIVLKLSIGSFYNSTIYFDYKLVNIDRNDLTYLFQNNWRYNNNFDTEKYFWVNLNLPKVINFEESVKSKKKLPNVKQKYAGYGIWIETQVESTLSVCFFSKRLLILYPNYLLDLTLTCTL